MCSHDHVCHLVHPEQNIQQHDVATTRMAHFIAYEIGIGHDCQYRATSSTCPFERRLLPGTKHFLHVRRNCKHLLFLQPLPNDLNAHMRTIIDLWIIYKIVSTALFSLGLRYLQSSCICLSVSLSGVYSSSRTSTDLSTFVTGTVTAV
jgi:hypothetical protein